MPFFMNLQYRCYPAGASPAVGRAAKRARVTAPATPLAATPYDLPPLSTISPGDVEEGRGVSLVAQELTPVHACATN